MNPTASLILKRILYFSTLLLAAFPVMPLKVQSFVIILFLAASFAGLWNINRIAIRKKAKWVLLFSFIPLLFVIYIFLSKDTSSAVFHTEKRLSLLVIPLAFLLRSQPFEPKQLNAIKLVFIAACLLVVIKLYTVFIVTGFIQNVWADKTFYYTFRTAAEVISGFHPSYLALYLSFSICILLVWLLFDSDNHKKYLKSFAIIGLVMFTSVLWLLAARMSLLALFIAVLLIAFWRLKNIRSFSLVAMVLVGLIALSIALSPSLSKRMGQLINSGLSMPKNEDFNETNIRLAIYACSIKLLNNNWYSGVGPGDVRNHLNDCYQSNFDSEKLREKNYNTHNEFLNIWISCGIVGFVLFLMMLWLPLKMAIDENQRLFILFILLFAFSCLTENILSRQHGVVFYAFFNSLLFFNVVLKPIDPLHTL